MRKLCFNDLEKSKVYISMLCSWWQETPFFNILFSQLSIYIMAYRTEELFTAEAVIDGLLFHWSSHGKRMHSSLVAFQDRGRWKWLANGRAFRCGSISEAGRYMIDGRADYQSGRSGVLIDGDTPLSVLNCPIKT